MTPDGALDSTDIVAINYVTLQIDSWIWPTMNLANNPTLLNAATCAAFCDVHFAKEDVTSTSLVVKECGFFVYHPAAICFPGNFTYTRSTLNPTADLHTVSVHKSIAYVPCIFAYECNLIPERTLWLHDKIFEELTMTSSEWPPQIYHTLTLTNTDNAEDSKLECFAHCMLHRRYCFFYIVDGSSCHLGDPNVNTNVVTTGGTVTSYQRICEFDKTTL